MNLSGKDRTAVGIRKISDKKFIYLEEKQQRVLLRIIRNIIIKTINAFIRNDRRTLLVEAVPGIGLTNVDKLI